MVLGKVQKSRNGNRRSQVFRAAPVLPRPSPLYGNRLAYPCCSSSHHAPTPMADTLRRIKGEGNGVPVERRNGTPS
jgi:hypothetical protein